MAHGREQIRMWCPLAASDVQGTRGAETFRRGEHSVADAQWVWPQRVSQRRGRPADRPERELLVVRESLPRQAAQA